MIYLTTSLHFIQLMMKNCEKCEKFECYSRTKEFIKTGFIKVFEIHRKLLFMTVKVPKLRKSLGDKPWLAISVSSFIKCIAKVHLL